MTATDAAIQEFERRLQNQHDWRNIQEIVRTSFRALFDIIHAQAEKIERLEQEKVTVKDFLTALQTKSDVADTNAKFEMVGTFLDAKAGTEDVAVHLDTKADKAELQRVANEITHTFGEMQRSLDQKYSIQDFQSSFETKCDKADLALISSRIDLVQAEITTKANSIDVAREIERKAEVDEVNKALDTKCDKGDYEEKLKDKASRQSVIAALKHKANVTTKLTSVYYERATRAVCQVRNAASDATSVAVFLIPSVRRPTVDQVELMMKKKADITSIQAQIQQRPERGQVEDMVNTAVNDIHARLENEVRLLTDGIRKTATDVASEAASANQRAVGDIREMKNQLLQKADKGELLTQHTALVALSQQTDVNFAELRRLLQV
ncbi:MAG: hypothetical protein EZS28_018821 [Streblomastix strix]|uniref:Uncharacterized protein n=1 Tax=Streblomastix strix TaxID=222440 RepID=A0A5J4VSV1_9EUKA|nr:MAG: hypothetical protein EZS28_018821 [Streblomastix strix]